MPTQALFFHLTLILPLLTSSQTCSWFPSNFNTDNEIVISFTSSQTSCLDLVSFHCPDSSIGNFDVDDGTCWCQYGDNYAVDPTESVMSYPMDCHEDEYVPRFYIVMYLSVGEDDTSAWKRDYYTIYSTAYSIYIKHALGGKGTVLYNSDKVLLERYGCKDLPSGSAVDAFSEEVRLKLDENPESFVAVPTHSVSFQNCSLTSPPSSFTKSPDHASIGTSFFNTPSCSVDGVALDGSNQFLSLDSYTFGGSLSLSVTFLQDSLNDYAALVNIGSGASMLNQISIYNGKYSGTVNHDVIFNSGEGGQRWVTTKASDDKLEIGVWMNLVVTYSKSIMKIYKNGELVEQTVGDGQPLTDPDHVISFLVRNNFHLGRPLTNSDEFFRGTIKSIDIWNGHELTQEEISLVHEELDLGPGHVWDFRDCEDTATYSNNVVDDRQGSIDVTVYTGTCTSNSLTLNGMTDYATIASTVFGGKIVVELLIVPLTSQDGGIIYTGINEGYDRMELNYKDSRIVWEVFRGYSNVGPDGTVARLESQIAPVNDGIHVVLTCHGNVMRMYVNGIIVDEKIHGICPRNVLRNGLIGRSYNDEYFSGRISYIKLWHGVTFDYNDVNELYVKHNHINCPLGEQTNPTYTGCTSCAPGKYSDTTENALCISCNSGYYNANTGSVSASECVMCGDNQVSMKGSSACTTCPADSIPNVDTSECISSIIVSTQTELFNAISNSDAAPNVGNAIAPDSAHVKLNAGDYRGGSSAGSKTVFVIDGLFFTLECEVMLGCSLDGDGARRLMFVESTGNGVLRLVKLRIVNGEETGDGGGVYILAGKVEVTSCSFENNLSGGSGGALFVGGNAVVDFFLTSFTGNSAGGEGDDMFVSSGGVIVIHDTVACSMNSEASEARQISALDAAGTGAITGPLFSQDPAECVICEFGAGFSAATSSCATCPEGSHSPDGGSGGMCILCAHGFYGSVPGADSCHPCEVGEVSPIGATACEKCEDDYVPNSENSYCLLTHVDTQFELWNALSNGVSYTANHGSAVMENGSTLTIAAGRYHATTANVAGYADTDITYAIEEIFGSLLCEFDGLLCLLEADPDRSLMWIRGTGGQLLAVRGIKFVNGDSFMPTMYILQGAKVDFVGCSFVDNHAEYSGGAVGVSTLAGESTSVVTFFATSFVGNSADGPGADIYNSQSLVTISDACASDNFRSATQAAALNTQGNILGPAYSFDPTSCVSCSPGMGFSFTSDTGCEECSPGTYAPPSRTGSCLPCPKDTINTIAGATSLADCTACPNGKASSAGSAECYDCYGDSCCLSHEELFGAISNYNGEGVVHTGSTLITNGNKAILFPGTFKAGTFSPLYAYDSIMYYLYHLYGTLECIETITCVLDGDGVYSIMKVDGTGAPNRVLKLVGLKMKNGGFLSEGAGMRIVNGANVVLEKCAFENNIAGSGSTVYVSEEAATVDFYATSFNGGYSNGGVGVDIVVIRGNSVDGSVVSSPSTVTVHDSCDADGELSAVEGSALNIAGEIGGSAFSYEPLSCFPCAAGTGYSITESACAKCIVGKYSPENLRGGCVSCGPGFFNPSTGSETKESCQECGSGSSSSSATDRCFLCEPGKYSVSETAAECSICPLGYHNPETGSKTYDSCVECAENMVSSEDRSYCVECEEGFAPNSDRTACRLFVASTHNHLFNAISNLDTQMCIVLMGDCVKINAGEYIMDVGDTLRIAPGSYRAGEEGLYASAIELYILAGLHGALECVEDLACVLDGEGTRTVMWVVGTGIGILKLIGLRIVNGVGFDHGAGGLVVSTGSTVDVLRCSFVSNQGIGESSGGAIFVGQVFGNSASSTVDLYGNHFWKNTASNGGNDIHVNEAYSSVVLHDSCGQEFGGSTVMEAGLDVFGSVHGPKFSMTCILCEAGSFFSGTTCLDCDVGSYADSAGSLSCTPCGEGNYNPLKSSTSPDACRKCAAGKASGAEQSSSCFTCPVGTHANAENGASACVDCKAGLYNPDRGSSSSGACLECEKGFTSYEGDAACFASEVDKHHVNSEKALYNKISRAGNSHVPPGETVVIASGEYVAGLVDSSSSWYFIENVFGHIECNAVLSCKLDGEGARSVFVVKNAPEEGELMIIGIMVVNAWGSGLRLRSGSVTVMVCAFEGNSGTGITVQNGGQLALYGVSFRDNTGNEFFPDIFSDGGVVEVHGKCAPGYEGTVVTGTNLKAGGSGTTSGELYSFTAECSEISVPDSPPLVARIISWVSYATIFTFIAGFTFIGANRSKVFVARHKVGTFVGIIYSMFDWFMDLQTVRRMFEARTSDGNNFASAGCAILVVNFLINIMLQAVIIREQKRLDNIDKKSVRLNALYIGTIHILSINHLSTMALWPWKRTAYYGSPSRTAFRICKIAPLFLENIPQLGVSLGYLSTSGGPTDLVVVGSAVCSVMSILFTLLGSLSVSFVMDDNDVTRPSLVTLRNAMPRTEGGGATVTPVFDGSGNLTEDARKAALNNMKVQMQTAPIATPNIALDSPTSAIKKTATLSTKMLQSDKEANAANLIEKLGQERLGTGTD